MTIFAALALALQAAPPTMAVPMPPVDWTGLPTLELQHRWPAIPALSDYVREEVRAGRCAAAMRVAGGYTLTVDVAVMVGATGQLRRIVPRAIQCPTVEQYASGIVSRMARGNVAGTGVDAWYHMAMTFWWAA